MTTSVAYDVGTGVARIVLNRPEVSNAIDLVAARDFATAVARALEDDSVRVIVIAGEGRRFCAGGDVASMAEADDPARYVYELATTLDAALISLSQGSKAVVAAVHGAVAGAGLAVMLTADIVVAETSTRFVAAYAKVGLTPDCGLSWLLPRAVGHHRAADLLLTGRTLDGAEAHEWGMVSRVVEDGNGLAAALEIASGVAVGPAHAVGSARELLMRSWRSTRTEAGADEARRISEAVQTTESQSLIRGFLCR